jgi:hypothetical protein
VASEDVNSFTSLRKVWRSLLRFVHSTQSLSIILWTFSVQNLFQIGLKYTKYGENSIYDMKYIITFPATVFMKLGISSAVLRRDFLYRILPIMLKPHVKCM